jgi:hypothetical protein
LDRWHPKRRAAKNAVLIGGALLVFVVTALLTNGAARYPTGAPAPTRRIVIPATYTGIAAQRGAPERLELTDRIAISNASLGHTATQAQTLSRRRQQGSAPENTVIARELAGAVERGLLAQKWRFREQSSEGIAFVRHRQVSLHVRTLPPETGNTIEIPHKTRADSFEGIPVDLHIAPSSHLVLSAPSKTFGPSFPEASRQTRPIRDLEVLSIPVAGVRTVEIDLRSPWFRNDLLAGFADLTALGTIKVLFGFLVTILIALFSEEARAALKRGLGRVRKRSGGNGPRPDVG